MLVGSTIRGRAELPRRPVRRRDKLVLNKQQKPVFNRSNEGTGWCPAPREFVFEGPG
jgi:hypothetical protein